MEVRAAMAKAKHIPLSVAAWRDAHIKSIHSVAKLESRDLTDRDLFAAESMQRLDQLVTEVFSESNLERLAEDRVTSLLEAKASPTFDPNHHVTHTFFDLIDVLDDTDAAHTALVTHKENLHRTHARIREAHPEHHDVVPASLFELVSQHKKAPQASATGILQTLHKLLTAFLRGVKWLWRKTKMVMKTLARIILHLVGNSYIGLGLDASVLPVPGAGPMLQMCFDATGLIFGSTTAQTVVKQEWAAHLEEKNAEADANIALMNGNGDSGKPGGGASPPSSAELMDARLMFLEVEQNMKRAGIHTAALSRLVGNGKEDEKSSAETDLPDAEYNALDASREAGLPSVREEAYPVPDHGKDELREMQAEQDSLFTSRDQLVDPSELNPDAEIEASTSPAVPTGDDGADPSKGQKKEGIKAVLKAFQAAIVTGWHDAVTNAANEREELRKKMKSRLAKAEGLAEGADVEDGAIRFCLNFPFVGMFPSVPHFTLALSLAMVQGFAEGTANNLAPWLKRKSDEIHPQKLMRAFAEGQLGKAKRLVAREMFIWQNGGKTKRNCALSPEDVKSSTKYRKQCFKDKLFQYQTLDCAKDRYAAHFPDLMAKKAAEETAFLDETAPSPIPPRSPRSLTRGNVVKLGRTALMGAEDARLGALWDRMTGLNATRGQRKEAKGWLKGAETQLRSTAKHWSWAMPKVTSGSLQDHSPIMAKFANYVKTQLPIVIVKLLSDTMQGLARGISKVLGMVDEDDAAAAEAEKAAAEGVEASGGTVANNGARTSFLDLATSSRGIFGSSKKEYPNIVNYPQKEHKYYLGDEAELVFYSGDLRQACGDDASITVELLQDTLFGKDLHGRWKYSKSDLDKMVVPQDFPRGGGRERVCGVAAAQCKLLPIKLMKWSGENNPENRDIVPSAKYFFRLSCQGVPDKKGKRMFHVSKNEPRFKIAQNVRPDPSPCKQTMQITFGVFPLKYPVGIDANLITCGRAAINKIKNFVAGMKNKKTREEHAEVAKESEESKGRGAGAGEGEKENEEENEEEKDLESVQDDLESGGMDPETEEDAEMAGSLGVAEGNSAYGSDVVSHTARESPSCSRLRVFGGVGIDLGAIDVFLTASRAWIKGLSAAVAFAMSVRKNGQKDRKSAEDNVSKAWLPTKRELEIHLIKSGAVDSLEDDSLRDLLGVHANDEPDYEMTEIDLKLLKSSDDVLNLIITNKQKEMMEVGVVKVATTGKTIASAAVKTARVIQLGLVYYILLSAGQAASKVFQGKGLGLEVHAAFGPIGSAFKCMGSMAVALGKRVVARLRRKSVCMKNCVLNDGDAKLTGLAEQAASNAEQCDHASFIAANNNMDLRARPILPVCQLSPRSMLGRIKGSRPMAFCSACRAVGEDCGVSGDCATGICAKQLCLASNVLPGQECTRDEQCLSETCQQGMCTVTDDARCQGGATSPSGPKGGCHCTHDNDCGGGKCEGYKKRRIGWARKGVCSGPAAPALCNRLGVEEHCCTNIECEWKAGTCEGGVASWPHRPHCDGAKKKSGDGSQMLLKANL
jgi:hypothetical protein